MSEAYRPHAEPTKEKDVEKAKKGHKKHVTKAHLGKTASHHHVSHERHHRVDEEASQSPVVEAPKKFESESTPKAPDEHITPAEEAAWPDELKKLHDEIVASVPKEEDETTEKLKKPVVEQKTAEDAARHEEVAKEPELIVEEVAHAEPVLPEDVEAPAMAELVAMGIPEKIITTEEAGSHPEEPMSELPAVELSDAARVGAVVPEVVAPIPDHELEPAAATALPEGDTGPLIPATELEAYGYGDSDTEPWGQPAGGLANAKVLEKLDTIDKRERLNDAYHGSREAGLGAFVGLVGLGLILEHFAAKRRDKKLKRQLDAQNRQLKQTNQAVALEQRSTVTAGRKLERIEAAQAAKSEHARTVTSALQSAEAAAAATEQGKTGISATQEKVLADRLAASKDLGQAIKQNPELKGMTDSQELVRSLALAEEQSAKQEQRIAGLTREASFEKLRGKYADNGGPVRSGGAGVDSRGMPVLPSPQQQLPAGVRADLMLDEHALSSKGGKQRSSAIVPVAAVTVLLILAALILIVFAKL